MRRLRWVQIRDARAAEHVDLDAITAGGPDYEDEEYEIVSEARADNEYAVGYAPDGTPVLIDEDAGCAYAVDKAGTTYEQPYQGFVWYLEDSWVESEVLWTEDLGKLTHYAIGKAGDRYYFSWSQWQWPVQNEDGQDEVPSENIENWLNGIHWYDSLAQAVDDASDAIEILGDVHPVWGEEALDGLNNIVR